MTDSSRRSNRLQFKDKLKRSQNKALKAKFSPIKKEQDEDMSVLQSKQARVPQHAENVELSPIIGTRTNNFTRVHNSYCTFDRMKYDGYINDPTFIDDGSSTSSGSREELRREGSPCKPRRGMVCSSSDSGVEEREMETKMIKQIVLETPLRESGCGERNVLKREKPRVSTDSSSDEELISSARKPKISVLSSSAESDSDELICTSRKRTPSLRALKVQSKMDENREKKFANFRAKRIHSKQSLSDRATPDPSVINLREERRKLREEAALLPAEHQALSGLHMNRNLFGDSPESSSADERPDELNSSYLQALSYTQQLVGEEEFTLDIANDSDGSATDKSPPLPLIYDLSDTGEVQENSQNSTKQENIPTADYNSSPSLGASISPNATESEIQIDMQEFNKFSPVEPGCTDACIFSEVRGDKLSFQDTPVLQKEI